MIFFLIQRNNLIHFQSFGWNNTLHHHHLQYYAQFNKKKMQVELQVQMHASYGSNSRNLTFYCTWRHFSFLTWTNVPLDQLEWKFLCHLDLQQEKLIFFFFQRSKKEIKRRNVNSCFSTFIVISLMMISSSFLSICS